MPPKPKSKPNPPEFSIKEKQKKEKVKKIDESPQQKKEKKNRMDSILKSIEKIKKDNQKTLEDEKKDDEKIEDKEEIKEVRLGEKLTISEKDAIRRQFYRCWIVPAGAKDLKKLVVSIRIKLNEDGQVVNAKLLTDSKLNNPFFRAASESAMRAVNHPECKKLQVPKKNIKLGKKLSSTLILLKV